MINTSEVRISVVVDSEMVIQAADALKSAFGIN